jgi:hypothetical protein
MTAPTTRETADHAELARLRQHIANMKLRPGHHVQFGTPSVSQISNYWNRDLASDLEALLSEIAALRVQVETEKRLSVDNWNVATDRATQAERQRDEAVGLLRPFARLADEEGGYREADRLAWGLNNCEITWGDLRAARTFLANQGADQ